MLSLAVFTYINVFSASGNYKEAMQVNLARMYKAKTAEELSAISSVFYRISAKDNKEWLPLYYASYAMVRSTFFEKDVDKVDRYLDVAQKYIDNLVSEKPAVAEVCIWQALIYAKRITGPTRAIKYSQLSNEALDKAEKLEANNPRLLYCRGNNVFHMPSFWGGGKDKAKPLYEQAKKLFEEWKLPNDLWPNWGEYHNKIMLDKCNKEEW